MTEQVYVALLPLPVGPVLLAHATPLTPIIDQLPDPVGVAPPDEPVTVAVKVKDDPSEEFGVFVLTVIEGIILVMSRVNTPLGPALV